MWSSFSLISYNTVWLIFFIIQQGLNQVLEAIGTDLYIKIIDGGSGKSLVEIYDRITVRVEFNGWSKKIKYGFVLHLGGSIANEEEKY